MRIGIISAMPSEVRDLRNALGNCKNIKSDKFDFAVYTTQKLEIISCCSGIGKVNAAAYTQKLISEFKVDFIINPGIGGGMGSEVKICDIIIADKVIHHDLEKRFLDNYPPYVSEFRANPELVEQLKKSCVVSCYPWHIGTIVSGEQFVTSTELKNQINEAYHPMSVDMESSAVGHVCFMNSVPFAIIRCISDCADDNGAMDFDKFEKIAAEREADIILDIISKIREVDGLR